MLEIYPEGSNRIIVQKFRCLYHETDYVKIKQCRCPIKWDW